MLKKEVHFKEIDPIQISIIIPIHNAKYYLDECLYSIYNQNTALTYEICCCIDNSTDNSLEIVNQWKFILNILKNIKLSYICAPINKNNKGNGCGYARNKSLELSIGKYICLQDADDIMMEDRLELQYTYYKKLEKQYNNQFILMGSNFERYPANSTSRYSNWLNRLTSEQCYYQRYKECTIIAPTWFYSRQVYNKVGKFNDNGPEDLDYFYRCIDHQIKICKFIDKKLIKYRYHYLQQSYKISRKILIKLRVNAFTRQILDKYDKWTKHGFIIWGCGRDGKYVYNLLLNKYKKLVKYFFRYRS